MLNNHKVLIFGSTGQVGSEIVKIGEDAGVNFDKLSHKQVDIKNKDSIEEYLENKKIDVIINVAGYTDVEKSEIEKNEAYEINCIGVRNISEICLRRGIPIFHLSTDYVYNGFQNMPYKESDQEDPLSEYGKSKLNGDKEIISKLERYIILRVSWVFGANGKNFVKSILKASLTQDNLQVVSDQIGCPTSSKSIASTLIEILTLYLSGKEIKWGVYNYSGMPKTSWYDFSKQIITKASDLGVLSKCPIVTPVLTSQYKTQAVRPKYSVLNCQKIYKEFGIEQSSWEKDLDYFFEKRKQ
jgi:dTDP-4-dehydrorhamnose reductase